LVALYPIEQLARKAQYTDEQPRGEMQSRFFGGAAARSCVLETRHIFDAEKFGSEIQIRLGMKILVGTIVVVIVLLALALAGRAVGGGRFHGVGGQERSAHSGSNGVRRLR
jgi:hypothetical protein